MAAAGSGGWMNVNTDKLELKKISIDSVEHALEKAELYRLLNDPEQAESICKDVLVVDPGHDKAKRLLILALTDQFAGSATTSDAKRARELCRQLAEPYEQQYFGGLVCEREARAFLHKGLAGSFAFESFLEAMTFFEEAEKLSPPHNDDAILRWNSCLRTIRARQLRRRADEPEMPLE